MRLSKCTLSLAPLLVSLQMGLAHEPASLPKFIFKNWGLNNSVGKSHIQAVDAWQIEEGKKSVTVAVIDTGVDFGNRLLNENLWADPEQKNFPVHGWNFVTNSPNPKDDHGHGTHVAGIIGATADAKNGVAGVARKVSIMGVKYYSEKSPGTVNLANTVKAIEYAIKKGAKIINYSGGGPDFSEEEYNAIRKAEAAGILFVAAAGNEHQDADHVKNYYYPSAYGLSNIISVAATDIQNQLLRSSNWGRKKVDVAAPGENIYSTLPQGKFGYMTGTSQATAFVSGIAALLLSHDPTLKPQELKDLIVASVDKLPSLKGKISSEGRVNAYQALLALKTRMKGQKPEAVKIGVRKIATRPTDLMKALSTPGFTE